MAEKKICDVCGKRINGFNMIGYKIHESMICNNCYDKLDGFKTIKKYNTIEEAKADKEKYVTKVKELQFPSEVVRNFEKHFDNKIKNINKREILIDEIDNHIVTTTNILDGYVIEEYFGIVADQCVLGTGMFSSWDASMADMTGTESSAYSQKLDAAREVATKRAIKKSCELGGNAIVGADLEFSIFPNAMIGIIFKGTCVKVRKIEK